MLRDKILSTLRFFDLQDIPLTLLELHRFLIRDIESIKKNIDKNFEIINILNNFESEQIQLSEILLCIENECVNEVVNFLGFYCLAGREKIVDLRWKNYYFGIKRERRIKKFVKFLKFIPFVRGVAVGGSQALGQQTESSDIDLLIITHKDFMYLARTLVSLYFQFLGLRRHGKKIRNRFCLNHYIAGSKEVSRERNLYKAMEYGRLRPLVLNQGVKDFIEKNLLWINMFMPNVKSDSIETKESFFQKVVEFLLQNKLGQILENLLKKIQKNKIHTDEFTFILEDELSFHPQSGHIRLLEKFFAKTNQI